MNSIKNLILFFASFAASLTLAEALYTYLHITHRIDARAIWFNEATDPSNNHRFDPHIGYRISSIPSRFGVVQPTGQLETMGILKGNNFGFPDKRDFAVRRTDKQVKRVAVLGDSFTASQFTPRSWLEIAEEEINSQSKDSIVFMNFSLDGGGLANWRSIVHHIILNKKFDLDGIVFAVCGDDLDRKFIWYSDFFLPDGQLRVAAGRSSSWLPDSNPVQRDTINPRIILDPYLVLDPDEVDAIVAGRWKFKKPLKPYLLTTVKRFICDFLRDVFGISLCYAQADVHSFEADQLELIRLLGIDCQRLNIPVLTLSLLTDHERTAHFAALINSFVIDDSVFQKWSLTNTEQIHIKGDGHWNQMGANAFAASIAAPFMQWLHDACILSPDSSTPAPSR